MPRTVKPDLNCIPVTTQDDVSLVPLPRSLWMPAGVCHCKTCHGCVSYFDTLAVPRFGETYLIHEPTLQPDQPLGHTRRSYHLAANSHAHIREDSIA